MSDTNEQNDPSNSTNPDLHNQGEPFQVAPADPGQDSDSVPHTIATEGEHPDTTMPSPTLPSGNPFTPGRPPPPERFFGRSRDRRQILERLKTMSSTALVGEARIGKSSLLKYLETFLPELLNETYLPVYICADVCDTQARFYKKMLDALLPQIPPRVCSEQRLRTLELKAQPARDDIETILADVYRKGLKVVLLLDEFKSMLDKPQEFDEPFLRWLRSLCNEGQVAMNVATRQPLDGITRYDLYFANHITQVITLEPLQPDEAQALLSQPHDRPFTADELAIGLQAGQNHPLRLQEAGFLLYTSKGEPPGDLHDQAGLLRPNAGNLLKKQVAQNYKQAKKWSGPSARNPDHPNRPDWLARVGLMAIKIGDRIDQGQARFYGVVVVLGIVVFLILFAAFLSGWISLEQLRTFWNVIPGGS